MVSRLMLNLREHAFRQHSQSTCPTLVHNIAWSDRAHITSTIIGNLGQSVGAWGGDNLEEDDEGDYILGEAGSVELSPQPRIVVEVTKDVTSDALRTPIPEERIGLSRGKDVWYPPQTWLLKDDVQVKHLGMVL